MRHVWLVVVLAIGACGKGGGASGPAKGKAEVTYQPAARVLERDEGLAAVHGSSTDGWTLVLDGKSPKLKGLKAGDILIIKGLVARKVLAVEQEPGDEIAVLTQSATLGEALQNAKVELDAPIRFPKKTASWSSWLEGTAYAENDISITGPRTLTVKRSYEGWDATCSATFGDGRVDLDMQVTKSVGGFKALITGKGYVQDFDISSSINVSGGTVDRLRFIARNLNGRMDFTWELGKESPGVETGKAYIKLPASVEIPLAEFLDGMPLFLEISSAVLIEPAMTGGGEITKGSFHVTYNGTDGFELKGGKPDAGDAKMDGDTDMDSVQAMSAAAPIGLVVAFAAPRFELSFGLAKVFKGEEVKQAAETVDKIADKLITSVFGADGLAKWKASPMGGFSFGKATEAALSSDASAWLEIETSTGMTASGAMAIVPCRKSEIHIAATAGAGAQVLGTQVAHESTTIFKKDFSKVEPPNLKACQ